QRKGIQLDHEADDNLPEILVGDSLRLRQMLFNLVSNAIKFTEKGSVEISARVKRDTDLGPLVLFKVSDTGIGISEEQQKRIFNEFQQADSSTSRRYGGSGLGLTIVRKLVEAHEGTIRLESTPGKGTTIFMELPLAVGTEADMPTLAQQAEEDKGRLRGTRVLVADDEPYNRLLVRNILERWGATVDEVDNGKAVIERLEDARIYDVILMDVHMPEMDGVEATRHIRREMQLRVPILALTASSSPAEHQKVMDAGMDGRLLKPFQAEELFAFLTRPRTVVPEPITDVSTNSAMPEESSAQDAYTLDHLRQMARGDEAFVKRMLGLFVERAGKGLEELAVALEAGDRKEISGVAHRMIPPCRHLDLLGMAAKLKQLELEADGYDQAELQSAVGSIKESMEAILAQAREDLASIDA
ncbi:MAG: ATP-binding protein, partial [Bacteroidota bacterium]